MAASFAVSAQALKTPPTTLQIGIKKKIPEEQCTIRSRDGDSLSMHYTGTLFETGDKFDSSVDRNQPLEFTLGTGRVIKGWDLGLKNMCIGEKRRLVIPPHLGYGANGMGSAIPGGSTLVFDVELVDIHRSNPDSPTTGQEKQEFVKPLNAPGLDFTSPIFLFSAVGVSALLVIVYLATKSGEKVKEEPKVDQTTEDSKKD
ncbi:hypothetical protein PHYBLDRAFT_17816 [Phycomyces blakesleeanus NRRL 1555(-)]|uniref:peptidylprolyl isomerase n=2 Tax=Phycomyces blakesleeanus TaxID=4837 RepID=A0A162V6Y4_PHYB8|nr:hypothetical protein PHYBLDRAFT_17816 [Phycomyces blakesleeanus NRRL 1555(-)]OAD80442.1 hypothetical protein PHYBLDRAFT_17816 [Phycomyces blakesleeanus NRRL 1555(-)]|eukprot:XP_018298482.1 hypothetical protein PHYBLDRAFT_17816 [Phycomyces blakesleeanus NRRL 1555(-)]